MNDIITEYEDSVNQIVQLFCNKQKIDMSDGYWIGDCVGEVFDLGDTYTFNFTDILTDVRENAPIGEIFNWRDYCMRIWNINDMCKSNILNVVNYNSWLKGCPRISDAELTKKEEEYQSFINSLQELSKDTQF